MVWQTTDFDVNWKNGAIGNLDTIKGFAAGNGVPTRETPETVAANKVQPQGPLPMGIGTNPDAGKRRSKKPVTWTTALAFSLGAVLLFYFLLKLKLVKV